MENRGHNHVRVEIPADAARPYRPLRGLCVAFGGTVFFALKEESEGLMNRHAHVIGAGIVGVCCALALQRRGWQVTLIDRREPGQETSDGNAGVIGTGSIFPINNPGLWHALPAMLKNTHPALRFDPAYVLASLPWFCRFLSHATPASTRRRAAALQTLIGAAAESHLPLLKEAGIMHRLRDNGWLKVFRNESSFLNTQRERDLLRDFGVQFEVLDAGAVQALEPNLNPIFCRALFYPQSYSVDNPGRVVTAYADLFAARGGRIIKQHVAAITARTQGYSLATDQGVLDAHNVVVALGPWSGDLLKPLGYHFPLGFERGYNQHFLAEPGALPSRPVHDADGAYVMTPTDQGLRVLSGVELKARDAPSTPRQLEQILPALHQAVRLAGPADAEVWRGARPSLPDELPVLGAAPRHPGLWLAFGHQHIGFSTGAISGKIMASLMSAEPLEFDLLPFQAQRFV